MGIQGLQNLIKPALEQTTLHQFKGQKAAIDAMSFLYKGCYGYSFQLNNGQAPKEYMLYLLRIVRIVKLGGIEPIVVFDGRNLKAKDLTQKKREESKEKNLQKANELMEQGKKSEAVKYFQRCLRVNKDMIYDAIDMLRANNIEYLISPYEADSQVAFMVKQQLADIAITEDSDLITYSCPRTIFKLQLDSTCQYFDLLKYTESQEERNKLKSEPLRCFLGQNDLNRIYICIMAGSDYFPSIQGIGIKKAIDLFYKCSDFKGVMTKLRSEPKMKHLIPHNYDIFVDKVTLIFQHQRVYDPETNKLVPINPFPSEFSSEDERLIGEIIPHFEEVSKGQRHIYSLEKRELKDIDMRTYFNTKHERKQFTIQPQGTSAIQQQENIQKTHENEKHHYDNHKVDPNQIKKLLKPSEILQLQELKKKEEEELNQLIDSFNPEFVDLDFETGNANNEETDENFVKFGENYMYSEEFQIQKKNNQDYTSYLENLCNTFLHDYQSYLHKDDSQDMRITTKVVRRQSSNLTSQQDTQEVIQQQEVSMVKLNNPFAKKSQKQNAFQPDSLDDLNLQRMPDANRIPPKKVVLDNKEQYKDEPKDMSQKSQTNSQKKVTMKDFFSKKK